MDSQTTKAFFSLLRAGLWEKEIDDISTLPLSPAQWQELYNASKDQTVTGVIYRGICQLREDLFPDDRLMMRWAVASDVLERSSAKMDTGIRSLSKLLGSTGAKAVLMKGHGVAKYYEHPELRVCGDIDLFFPSDNEEKKVEKALLERGFSIEKQPDGSNCYQWFDIEVEHHPALFDISNPNLKEYLKGFTFGEGFQDSGYDNILTPSPTQNLLLLNAHLLKHLIGHGIGLRQFCDIARAYHVLNGEYDRKKLKAVYTKTGLMRWSKQLHAFLIEYIGLDPNDLPFQDRDSNTSKVLLKLVMDGGNFGMSGDTRTDKGKSSWLRKMNTFLAFWKHGRFSLAYAPKETFWTVNNLIKGNLS